MGKAGKSDNGRLKNVMEWVVQPVMMMTRGTPISEPEVLLQLRSAESPENLRPPNSRPGQHRRRRMTESLLNIPLLHNNMGAMPTFSTNLPSSPSALAPHFLKDKMLTCTPRTIHRPRLRTVFPSFLEIPGNTIAMATCHDRINVPRRENPL